MCEGNRRRSFSLSQTLGPKVPLPLRPPVFPRNPHCLCRGRVAWPPNSAPPRSSPPPHQSELLIDALRAERDRAAAIQGTFSSFTQSYSITPAGGAVADSGLQEGALTE